MKKRREEKRKREKERERGKKWKEEKILFFQIKRKDKEERIREWSGIIKYWGKVSCTRQDEDQFVRFNRNKERNK